MGIFWGPVQRRFEPTCIIPPVALSGRRSNSGGSGSRARHEIVVCPRPLLPVGAVRVLPPPPAPAATATATTAVATAATEAPLLGGPPATAATAAAVAEAGCARLVPADPSACNSTVFTRFEAYGDSLSRPSAGHSVSPVLP